MVEKILDEIAALANLCLHKWFLLPPAHKVDPRMEQEGAWENKPSSVVLWTAPPNARKWQARLWETRLREMGTIFSRVHQGKVQSNRDSAKSLELSAGTKALLSTPCSSKVPEPSPCQAVLPGGGFWKTRWDSQRGVSPYCSQVISPQISSELDITGSWGCACPQASWLLLWGYYALIIINNWSIQHLWQASKCPLQSAPVWTYTSPHCSPRWLAAASWGWVVVMGTSHICGLFIAFYKQSWILLFI